MSRRHQRLSFLLVLYLILSMISVTGQNDIQQLSFVTSSSTERLEFSTYLEDDQFIVLDAFATWCEPCKAQILELRDVYDVAKDDVTILSISMDIMLDDLLKVDQFKDDFDAKWTFGLDDTEEIKNRFNVTGYPETYVIHPNGTLLKTWKGYTPANEILTYLDGFLDLPGSFGRSINFEALLVNLINGPTFYIFLAMLWAVIFFAIYNVWRIQRLNSKQRDDTLQSREDD